MINHKHANQWSITAKLKVFIRRESKDLVSASIDRSLIKIINDPRRENLDIIVINANMFWGKLVSIKRVKGITCKRSRNKPFFKYRDVIFFRFCTRLPSLSK